MHFFYFFLFHLHLLSILCCKLDPYRQEGQDKWWPESCITAAKNTKDLGVCLLQRNSLRKVLECASWKKNSAQDPISWKLPANSEQDLLDLIPNINANDKFDFQHDGILKVTPRGVLVAAAATEECQQCRLAQVFHHCPFTQWQDFIDCLCCQKVEYKDIECFKACIWNYETVYGEQSVDKQAIFTCPSSPRAACVFSGAPSSTNQLNAEDLGPDVQASFDDGCSRKITVVSGETTTMCATSRSFSRTLTIPGSLVPTSLPSVTYSSRTSAPNTAYVATYLTTAPTNDVGAQTSTSGVGRLNVKMQRILILFFVEFISVITVYFW